MDALGCQYVTVDCDDDGISSSALAEILANWDHSKPFPKVLYTVPVGPSRYALSFLCPPFLTKLLASLGRTLLV